MKIGPSRYSKGGTIMWGAYDTGEIAMRVFNELGEPESTPTVNVSPYGADRAPPGHVWLKGWGENQGIPEALEAAGVCRRIGKEFSTGYEVAELAQLTDEALADLERNKS